MSTAGRHLTIEWRERISSSDRKYCVAVRLSQPLRRRRRRRRTISSKYNSSLNRSDSRPRRGTDSGATGRSKSKHRIVGRSHNRRSIRRTTRPPYGDRWISGTGAASQAILARTYISGSSRPRPSTENSTAAASTEEEIIPDAIGGIVRFWYVLSAKNKIREGGADRSSGSAQCIGARTSRSNFSMSLFTTNVERVLHEDFVWIGRQCV